MNQIFFCKKILHLCHGSQSKLWICQIFNFHSDFCICFCFCICFPVLPPPHPVQETMTATTVRHVPSLSSKSLSCVTQFWRCDTCSDWTADLLSETKMKTGITGPTEVDQDANCCQCLCLRLMEPLNHRGIKERRLPTFCLNHTLHEGAASQDNHKPCESRMESLHYGKTHCQFIRDAQL